MSSPATFTSGGGAGAPASLERAYLELCEPPPGGGSASQPGGSLGTIDFQFNPKELTLEKNAKWERDAQRNASSSGPPQFTGAEPSKLNLEMFLDATERMDDSVVKTVERLFACCVPTDRSLQDRNGVPPWVIFHWGGITGFPSYVSKVTAKYTLFTPGGLPVRALCTVALEEISGETPGQNPTSGALAAGRSHVLVAGDTLPSLSYQAYGNAGMWRLIAEFNDIDDPMRLPIGRRLLIPASDELD